MFDTITGLPVHVLVLHLVGLVMAFRKRGEPSVVRRALVVALSLGVLQLLVAGAMIGLRLPPVLRSLHQATGVAIWIATFTLAYLVRRASGEQRGEPVVPPAPPRARAAAPATMGHSVAVIVARGAES